jgi:hypothetical protein
MHEGATIIDAIRLAQEMGDLSDEALEEVKIYGLD